MLIRNATPSRNWGSHYLIEAGGIGHRFTRLAHNLDMPRQRLKRHILGFVERPTCSDAAGKIGKADAEIAVVVLVNDRNVIHGRRSLAQFQIALPFDGPKGSDRDTLLGCSSYTGLYRMLLRRHFGYSGANGTKSLTFGPLHNRSPFWRCLALGIAMAQRDILHIATMCYRY